MLDRGGGYDVKLGVSRTGVLICVLAGHCESHSPTQNLEQGLDRTDGTTPLMQSIHIIVNIFVLLCEEVKEWMVYSVTTSYQNRVISL